MTKAEFMNAVEALAESLWGFHERFNLPPLPEDTSWRVRMDNLRRRLPILVEETGEVARHIARDEMFETLCESADVAYIALGTLLTHGRQGADAAEEVATKNNRKTYDTHFMSSNGKLVKRA